MRQPKRIDDTILLDLHAKGKTLTDIAKIFGVSLPAVSKRLKRLTAPPMPESLEKLTLKEQAFVMQVSNGASATTAALYAFDCTTRESGKNIGQRLMKDPDIQLAVKEIMSQEGLTPRRMIRKLSQHVDHADPGISLKAIDTGLKLADLYPAAKNMNLNVNLANIDPIDLSEFRKEYGK